MTVIGGTIMQNDLDWGEEKPCVNCAKQDCRKTISARGAIF
jgi:hypothetical protein